MNTEFITSIKATDAIVDAILQELNLEISVIHISRHDIESLVRDANNLFMAEILITKDEVALSNLIERAQEELGLVSSGFLILSARNILLYLQTRSMDELKFKEATAVLDNFFGHFDEEGIRMWGCSENEDVSAGTFIVRLFVTDVRKGNSYL